MSYGQCADRKSRYRDLGEVIDYRQYRGEKTTWFEDQWLAPRIRALGYAHVRFFGGKKSSYDGSFSERVCEVARADSARPEYFIYG